MAFALLGGPSAGIHCRSALSLAAVCQTKNLPDAAARFDRLPMIRVAYRDVPDLRWLPLRCRLIQMN